MLIEIHLIQNHAPANLNRDDTGSPKECFFGGVKRARISSQCLKRTIRRSSLFRQTVDGNDEAFAFRTRRLPELVMEELRKRGLSEDLVQLAGQKATKFGQQEKQTDQESSKEDTKVKQQSTQEPITAQTMFLTREDVTIVADVLYEAATQKSKEDFEKLSPNDLQKEVGKRGFRPVTVDIALFGRMVTSDAFRNIEASVQVAHAISTHKVEHEFDYYTAVDDLKEANVEADETGADMLGDVEYNSACFYKYFSIDWNGLLKNLTGEALGKRDITVQERQAAKELATRAIIGFLKAAIYATPSGKQNSFAAHQLPNAVLVEVRPYPTPVSYANAFVEPAFVGKGEDLVQNSLTKLARHVEAMTRGYNLQAKLRLLLAPEYPNLRIQGVQALQDLNTLCDELRKVL
jgi:CRISPR system Cascade subunit CasC